MKKIIFIISALPLLFAAHAQQWTFQGGKQTNNGSVTVKSVDGSSSQSVTQNPTGAAAKVNQSAVTQPPTVLMQSTNRLPVVNEGAACNSATDQLAVTPGNGKALICSGGSWKATQGVADSCANGYVWTGGSCQAISSFASGSTSSPTSSPNCTSSGGIAALLSRTGDRCSSGTYSTYLCNNGATSANTTMVQ